MEFEQIEAQILAWARPEGWGASPLESYPLTDFPTAAKIAIGYLAFVFLGSLIMKNSNPVGGLYMLKFMYNVVQVMLCSYMCIEALVQAWKAGYPVVGCEFNQTNPPIGFILYVFYISKILDFLDTVFIILEKRFNQLSFLHVYHHTSIFLFYWLNVQVGYDGDIYLTIVLNGLIHTLMYTYYFVSMHTKDIWWKPALTMGQMIQFCLMNLQALYLIFTPGVQYPRNITVAYLFYILTLLFLFAQFFVQSYISPKKKDSSKKAK